MSKYKNQILLAQAKVLNEIMRPDGDYAVEKIREVVLSDYGIKVSKGQISGVISANFDRVVKIMAERNQKGKEGKENDRKFQQGDRLCPES